MAHPVPEAPSVDPPSRTDQNDTAPPAPPASGPDPPTKPSGENAAPATGTNTAPITDTRAVIVQPAELNLVEGETVHYTVALGSRPTAAVVITGAVDGEVSIDPRELRFLPATWATAQTVAVTAEHDDDALADPPVHLSHTVRGGGYGDIAVPPLPVTTAEDDAPTLWVAAATVQERMSRVTFEVQLSLAGDHRVTVDYETGAAGHSATPGVDYQDRSGEFVFPAGSAAVLEIAIPVHDDTLDEEDEQFTLTLSNAVHAALAGGGSTMAVLAVIEDDDEPPALSISSAGADEGAGTITFPVRLDRASGLAVTVHYATAPATAPGTAAEDQYTSVSGTLTLQPGELGGSIPVPIADDHLDEEDQTFSVTLTAPINATLAAGADTATGTIRDDDDPPTALAYAGQGDQVIILNSDWARLADKVYALNLGAASAEVLLIATNGTTRGKRSKITMVSQSAVAAYRDPPPRPALSVLPAIPTLPDDFVAFEPRPLSTAGRGAHLPRDDRLTFAASSDRETFSRVPATARSEVTDGSITATFWVADANWGDGCSGAKPCVTQEMVDAMAERFLRTGAGNDIYDWLTALFGVPWGAHAYTNIIPPEAAEHIHVLLSDIDGDGAISAGQCRNAGFYSPHHVYLNEESRENSAERLILFLDSPLYATAEGATWEVTDYRPDQILSTLAHEFHHMINYYQRRIVRRIHTESWLKEMAAEVAQDLIADKLMSNGPRAVAYDDPTAGSPGIEVERLPVYNLYNDTSVTAWQHKIANYAVVYAFGAYLARTYGAELFQKFVQSSRRSDNVVKGALDALGHNVSFRQVLADWAVANLLSDNTGAPAPYRYNSGAWTTSQAGGETFRLGSINLYHYRYEPPEVVADCVGPDLASRPAQDGPYLHSLRTFNARTLQPHSNRYASLGRHTGTVQFLVRTPADTRITLVVKE